MSNRRATLLFSFWAWLILAPPLITVWGGFGSAVIGEDRLRGVLAACGVHLLFGGCFWLAAIVERRLSNYWRWVWFILVLGAISVLRPTLADVLQDWSGLHAIIPPAFGIRVALNFAGLGGLMLIIYLALERVERAADTRQRLAAILSRTEQQRAAVELRHATLIVDFQRTIADPIRRAVLGVNAKAPPGKVADELMGVASRVVRPLADQAFAMGVGATEYQYRPPSELAAGRVLSRLTTPNRIEATMPLGASVFWLALQLPMALLAFSPLFAFEIALASSAVVFALTALVRLHPQPGRPALSILLLTIEYGLIGAVGTLLIVVPNPINFDAGFWVYGILVYAVAGTILSIARSSRLDYLATEQQLYLKLAVAKRSTNISHVELSATTNLLARRLHAAIQTDVVAVALQIRLGSARPERAVAELIQRVERVLDAPMLPTVLDDEPDARHVSADAVRSATRAADEAWREGIELESAYDEALWQWLTERPGQRAVVCEVCTRGLTNAIRYSRNRRATLTVRIEDNAMLVEIRHPGRKIPNDRRRASLAPFESSVKYVELVQDGGEIVYRVLA